MLLVTLTRAPIEHRRLKGEELDHVRQKQKKIPDGISCC
jgi:hypothetical protein